MADDVTMGLLKGPFLRLPPDPLRLPWPGGQVFDARFGARIRPDV